MNLESNSVSEWLIYIQTLHSREIELSLERVKSVYSVLCADALPFKVISVAGTNGKGSTAEIISSIYREAGFKVGKFTSPHLVRFNERFNLSGIDVTDDQLIQAFKRVESARSSVPITYFEYGLLLALALFLSESVDVAVMEVGLGGRLDAVNILDADVAIITSIALDHTAWLGETLEKIAYEKAGIARAQKPCVIGVSEPQKSMIEHLDSIDAESLYIGRDFSINQTAPNVWSYSLNELHLERLPYPFDQSGVQLSNAALAITAVYRLGQALPVTEESFRAGLIGARLAGRCQLVSSQPHIVLDVSHNAASLKRLAEFIRSLDIKGRIVVVCGMLQDKEIIASLDEIKSLVSHWHLCTINAERGADAKHMQSCLKKTAGDLQVEAVELHESANAAFINASQTLTEDDCLVVFGSFYVVGDIISLLDSDNNNEEA